MTSSRNRVRLACFAGMTVFAMSAQVLPPGLSSVSEEFGLDLGERGFLLALQYLGFFATSVSGGWLSDRLGRKRFLVTGLYLLALGLGTAPCAESYAAFGASMFLIGAGGGFVEVLISVLISDLFPKRKARALNQSQIFYNVGAIGMPFVVGVLLGQGLGWRPAYLLGAWLALGCGLWVHLLRVPPTHVARPEGEEAPETRPKSGLVWVLALVMMLYVGAEMTSAGWAPNYLELTFGVGRDSAAYSMTLLWFCMMLGRLAYVRFVERGSYLVPILISSLAGAVSATALIVSPVAWTAYVAVGALGLSLAGIWPTTLAYAGTRFKARSGRVFGLLISAGSLGLVLFPPLCGLLAEAGGNDLRLGLALAPVLLLLVAAVVGCLLAAERRAAGQGITKPGGR